MRNLVLLSALLALVAAPAADAATACVIDVVNHSGTCAWVTDYWAHNWTYSWEIAHGQVGYINNDPTWVKPGETKRFSHAWAESKVQAEFTKNPDCTGGVVKKAYDVRKNIEHDTRRVVNLVKQPDGYWAWFER